MRTQDKVRSWALAASWTLLCLAFGGIPPAGGESAAGGLSGVVRNPEGIPEEAVHVYLEGTLHGALSDRNGRFAIARIPPGKYTLLAVKLGYQTLILKDVAVPAGPAAEIVLDLKEIPVLQVPEIEISDRKKDIHDTPETHYIRRTGEGDGFPEKSVNEVLQNMPGVVLQAGELHVRGGRPREIGFEVDGIRINDPLHGSAPDLALRSVAQTELASGGFAAEDGNVQSAIVRLTTREGGETFSGEVDYATDDFGAPDKTFNNFDQLSLGMGGPTRVRDLTWFLSLQGTFEDGYLKTAERRPRQTILDFIRVGPRQNNKLQLQGKLAWKPGSGTRLTLEHLRTRTSGDFYSHIFSRNGYVQVRTDTLRSDGRIVTRYGRFSAIREDSSFVPYDAAGHTPDMTDDFRVDKLVWTHSLATETFYSLKLSRLEFNNLFRVAGKEPWEYDGVVPRQWLNQIDSRTNAFFATNGDFPRFTERHTVTWGFRGDLTHQAGGHQLKFGGDALYNDLDLLSIDFPTSVASDQGIGLFRSQYHYFNPEGSVYVQDRWKHEGMVLNAGLRYDVFSVGSQLDVSEVSRRYRSQISPRLGIAYPVTDRDVLSFHYGRFSQVPERSAIFENRGNASQVRGNPDLENETTVAYQAALQHMFTADVYGQCAVYFKDIFGLLTIDRQAAGDNPNQVLTWVNRDYASARGFELSLDKRFTKNFSGSVAYTYGLATGVASDPEQQRNVELLYLPISEQPLNWDQRHTFTARFLLSRPGEWLASLIFSYGSGFPFTPTGRNERRPDPSLVNAGRLPSVTNLSLQLEKHYSLWNQDVKVYLRGNNVMNARNLTVLEPDNWPFPPGSNLDDYRVYYSETGRAGGAYLGEDLNSDGSEDWVPLNDPRVFAEGRSLQVGLGVRF